VNKNRVRAKGPGMGRSSSKTSERGTTAIKRETAGGGDGATAPADGDGPAKKPTVRAIAARLGLSPATVSSALTGRRPSGFVTETTRRQVWDAARQMGYPLERLRAPKPLLERVALFSRANPTSVFQTLTLELCRLLGHRGQHVLIHTAPDHRQAVAIARDLYHRQEVDAALFVGSTSDPEALAVGDLPCVFIGEIPDDARRQWQVVVDNEGGGRAAGEHLWDLGHRRVGFISSASNVLSSEKRLRGLESAFAERAAGTGGAPPPPRARILDVRWPTEAEIAERLPGFLARCAEEAGGEPLTALFCYNDWLAGAVLKTLRRAGTPVPSGLAVVGFDDAIYAGLLDPPLTTVVHPFARLAEEAADLLLLRLRSPEMPPQVRLLPAHLVLRGSTTNVDSPGEGTLP
jgi:DNA-binding LacI/PurR family transcriptional regulator